MTDKKSNERPTAWRAMGTPKAPASLYPRSGWPTPGSGLGRGSAS
jgi:hypothetical protein